jgi:hypothetical protein
MQNTIKNTLMVDLNDSFDLPKSKRIDLLADNVIIESIVDFP